MFKSMTTAIARTFDVVTTTADAAEKALESGTHFVTEHSKANKLIVTTNAKMRVAKALSDHAEELKDNKDLSSLFDQVSAEW